MAFLCLLFLCFSSVFVLPSSSISDDTITLHLSPYAPNPNHYSSRNPVDFISDIAESTLHRAFHLKNKHQSNNSFQLFPTSPGIYTVNLPLGTPAQNIPVFFDTGSSLVWVPCTSHYSCSNCQNNTKITIFKPKRSSSKKSVNCSNKKCRWLDQPGETVSCPGCSRGSCSTPCAYDESYALGQTVGHAISDNLNLQGKVVKDFFLGCSSMSEQMTQGIAGFGRNPMSLPNQLKLDKFSHCFVSHNFDDTSKSSSLILGDSEVLPGVAYTPLIKNPPMSPFNEYYYVHLEKVTVGDKLVKIPQDILVPDSNGNGGTVVDSGSTLTSLVSTLFDPIANEFTAQMTPPLRKQLVLAQTSLGNVLCINVTRDRKLSVPSMSFHFKGGVAMDLTVENYLKAGRNLLCLPFVNVTNTDGLDDSGPAVIMGNYQQQNFHIEYDLKNERFGVKKKTCG